MFLNSLADQLIRKALAFLHIFLSKSSYNFLASRAMLAVKNVTHTDTVEKERNVDLQISEPGNQCVFSVIT